jgi:hypothetical protein
MCGIDRRRQTLHPIAYQVRTDGRKANDEAPEWWRVKRRRLVASNADLTTEPAGAAFDRYNATAQE